MLVATELSWYEAEEYCRSKNAYLAELIESDERDAVWNHAKSVFTKLILYFQVFQSVVQFYLTMRETFQNYIIANILFMDIHTDCNQKEVEIISFMLFTFIYWIHMQNLFFNLRSVR